MNISVDTIQSNISDVDGVEFTSSSLQNPRNIVSLNNRKHIATVKSFSLLNKNWDSYNAESPSDVAIIKAINFIQHLSQRNVEVFFTAPTPDGDIVIELERDSANIEFIFTSDDDDKIVASFEKEFSSECTLNETTLVSYLKWLICPNGTCPDF